MTNDIQEILLDEETISRRVSALGAEIDVHYEGEEILLITLLDGAIVFTADLIRNLRRPLRLDCIRVSSYGDSTSPESSPRILGNLRAEVEGRHVLLVDDILDTGNTLSRVQNEILSRNPASVHSCVLLDKPARRETPFKADWIGFSIPDHFVVGYGLDYAGRYRQLPHVALLKPEVYS